MSKKKVKLKTVMDETTKLPDKQGNGILRILIKADKQNKVKRYSLAYVNHKISRIDNGRVLGYDNSHGYHHRHCMGKEEAIEFKNFESVAERFESEWKKYHEKAKNK